MSLSADIPTLPATAPIWPPPPTSAPETFTVEGVTVTKHGELLTVFNPQARRTTIRCCLAQSAVFAVCFASSMKGWVEFHNKWGPKVPLLSDPFFLQQLQSASLLYLFMTVMYGALFWWIFVSSHGSGKTTFHRSTQSMQVGKQIYPVRSAFVRRQPTFRRPAFLVSFRTATVKKFSPPFRYLLYYFRHPENAQHLAEEVAAFLGVPIQE